jgi:hypothetical protein
MAVSSGAKALFISSPPDAALKGRSSTVREDFEQGLKSATLPKTHLQN